MKSYCLEAQRAPLQKRATGLEGAVTIGWDSRVRGAILIRMVACQLAHV